MNADAIVRPALQILAVIMDWEKRDRLADFLRDNHAHFIYTIPGSGTANSEILDYLGLGSVEKAVTLCVSTERRMRKMVRLITTDFGLTRPGKGIAFTLSLSGVSGPVNHVFERLMEKGDSGMEGELEKNREVSRNSLILSVINQGYSDELMDAAKGAGATGGTIIHARRVASEDVVKFFGITVQPEKEIVAIVASREHKRGIMEAINHKCGIKTEARGIILSVPLDGVYGLGQEQA